MYRMLVAKGWGGISPILVPARVNHPALLKQAFDFYVLGMFTWCYQSLFGMMFPMPGPVQMLSTESFHVVQDQYFRKLDPSSLLNAMTQLGEDAYLSHLMLEAGFVLQIFPWARSTSFLPENWTEHLAQQRRWQVAGFGNRTELLLGMPGAWRGHRKLLWPITMFYLLWQFLGSSVITVAFCHCVMKFVALSPTPTRWVDGLLVCPAFLLDSLIWAAVAL